MLNRMPSLADKIRGQVKEEPVKKDSEKRGIGRTSSKKNKIKKYEKKK